ncbi:MAG: 4'-phosphopantetheinyl transferase superfamily protein [Bacteroidota bacterium]
MTSSHPISIRLLGPEGARLEVLDEAERARLEGFAHADRRAGFVLGRTAARTLLADVLGCAPGAVPLTVGEDGAPRVVGVSHIVSIAHAGADLGGAAVALRPVGLDLERVRSRHPDLWQRILAPEEYSVLETLGGPTDEAQTLLWSLKEAVLKARRTGLRAGTRSVRLGALDSVRQRAEAGDADGGTWSLGFERRGDLWVSWALATEKSAA